MKDFFKILTVLVLMVISFVFGKNYGESIVITTTADISTNENEVIETGNTDKVEITSIVASTVPQAEDKKKREPAFEEKPVSTKKFDYERYLALEWMLINSDSKENALQALEKLKIKDLDSFLKEARVAEADDFTEFIGSYRGNIIGQTAESFGSLVVNFKKKDLDSNAPVSGEILVYRNGKEIIGSRFNSSSVALRIDSSSTLVLDNQRYFYQLYKVKNTGQLAGYFYERSVNGKTSVIGSFALNRVDLFE